MIHYAPLDRTKVRCQLIGKPLVPKTRVGSKALREFDAPFIIANIEELSSGNVLIVAVFGLVSRQNRPKVVVTSKMGRNLCDSFGSSSLIANLPWHGFAIIRGDERDIDDGKYGIDDH